jgi:hypothetical protein
LSSTLLILTDSSFGCGPGNINYDRSPAGIYLTAVAPLPANLAPHPAGNFIEQPLSLLLGNRMVSMLRISIA